jgi:hypothetical protein
MVENDAFGSTSITTIDLTGTVAESASVCGMDFLGVLILPRRCVLRDVSGLPALRSVTFGASCDGGGFLWHPKEVRFESLIADAGFSPGLCETLVYGEVACELERETLPFPPP